MKKKFNITGKCIPTQHYMADVSKKLEKAYNMVEEGEYFIINRPRQYGKTTTLYGLATALRATGKYIVFNTSFEGISEINFEDDQMFASGFVRLLAKSQVVDTLGQRVIKAQLGNGLILITLLSNWIAN